MLELIETTFAELKVGDRFVFAGRNTDYWIKECDINICVKTGPRENNARVIKIINVSMQTVVRERDNAQHRYDQAQGRIDRVVELVKDLKQEVQDVRNKDFPLYVEVAVNSTDVIVSRIEKALYPKEEALTIYNEWKRPSNHEDTWIMQKADEEGNAFVSAGSLTGFAEADTQEKDGDWATEFAQNIFKEILGVDSFSTSEDTSFVWLVDALRSKVERK